MIVSLLVSARVQFDPAVITELKPFLNALAFPIAALMQDFSPAAAVRWLAALFL